MAEQKAPSPQRVWVPAYTKSDGSQVGGYWRDNSQLGPKSGQGRRLPEVLTPRKK